MSHLRIIASLPDSAAVDLSLIKLPEEALMFPNPPGPGREIMLLAFCQKQCKQIIVDSDFALVAFFLRTLDARLPPLAAPAL